MEENILSVSQLNQYLKARMDADPLLGQLCIRGEISNYKLYPSGHHYFTLKDKDASLRCVLFRSYGGALRFRPENGMAVLATGRVTVFPRDGGYQLYCTGMTPDGAGDLHVAFEQLKKKLEEEGLFDRARKKPLPAYPHRIALITSSAGAAVRDMLRILGKRYPLSKVLLLPVRVQGTEAPAEICGAIRYANRYRLAEVIITGRGGGSIEDLWAFNDERVARAIAASELPVISAVGHEPDVTISDYVADLRAATPSNAAELVCPEQGELRRRLQRLQSTMQEAIDKKLKLERRHLQTAAASRVLQSPLNYLADKRVRLDYSHQRLSALSAALLAKKKQTFIRLTASLDAMSPLRVLARGYSVVLKQTGQIVRAASEVQTGEQITVRTGEGSLRAAVTKVEEKNGQ